VDLVIDAPCGRCPRTDGSFVHIGAAWASARVPSLPGGQQGGLGPTRSAGRSTMRRVRAEILNTRKLGAYHSLTLVAPEVAERARPGQFISVGMPGDRSCSCCASLLDPPGLQARGWAGTLEFAFDTVGVGTAWLAEARATSSWM